MPRGPRAHRVVNRVIVAGIGVDLQMIADFEARIRRPDDGTLRSLRAALTQAGVVFIAENGGGAGVRLKFNHREVHAINRWEAEGGSIGEHDNL
jgi:hypothetical protein